MKYILYIYDISSIYMDALGPVGEVQSRCVGLAHLSGSEGFLQVTLSLRNGAEDDEEPYRRNAECVDAQLKKVELRVW